MSRQKRDLLAAVIVSIVVVVVFLIAYMGPIFFSFITEFLAVVLGLYLGFSIDRLREAQKNDQDRRGLLCDLRCELGKTDEKLTGARFPNRLRVVIWDSAIASGQLRLLASGQMRSLTDVYNLVKEVDEYAGKVRDLYREYEQVPTSRGRLKIVLDRYASDHKIRESRLHEKIEKLLEEDWST